MQGNNQSTALKVVSIVILLAIPIVLTGLLLRHSSTSKNNSQPQSTNYKNKQYGIKFVYPSSWGNVKISEVNPKIPEGTTQKGRRYAVSFSNIKSVSMNFNSDDASTTTCLSAGNCMTSYEFTSQTVTNTLSNAKSKLFRYGSDYYSSINVVGNMVSLNYARSVKLPKVNASAVDIVYALDSSSGCKGNQIQQECIGQSIYDQISGLATSVAAD